jgi:S1-C subfamily serine protease
LYVGEKTNILQTPQFKNILPNINTPNTIDLPGKQEVVYEESVVTKVVEKSLASVVTISIKKTTTSRDQFDIDPFDPFSPFKRIPGKAEEIEQNIGSGFIISSEGLIITNKHVVADTEAKYTVITNDKKTYEVQKIYRDPLNDLSILKIDADKLKPLAMGDSSSLKLGQMAIAIGTPLGEFTNTVTVGIVSGLGRGITAGSPLEGYVEKLDNVIQTDAAINPGNSGGPLLNSAGQAIGINTAVAQEGQNIGFAIPINVARELIDTFNKQGGSFERPYIGVRYKMVDKQNAVVNDLIEGAYVIEVLANSPAEKAQIQEDDVIVEIDGKKIQGNDDQSLARAIIDKKVGDTIRIKMWRDEKLIEKTVKLEAAQ